MGLKIESVVEEKITSTISKLGFEIEYVEYVKEANNYILRIVLDKPNGTVDVDECEKVSRAVENIVGYDVVKGGCFYCTVKTTDKA